MSTAVVSGSVFLETLGKSGLYDAAGQADLRRHLHEAGMDAADGPGLAGWLVRHGYLTHFQSQQMLAGKWKNLIINRKFLILEPLGTGGMGAVFRCRHLTLHKDVALKILPAKLISDKSALQRFLREARALAALNDPNIVQAHDCDEANGQYFLVMGYVEGITLQQLVEKVGPLPAARAAYYIGQACAGLQHAHESGWVHRDLKPTNLVIDRSDTVKILDLGLARMMTDSGEPITRLYDEDSVLGSPDYIAPEQSLNSPDIDIRADIYSLGATLHFLLSGKPPFDGLPLMQKLLAHQLQEPPELRRQHPEIPPEVAGIAKRMMAKAPIQRYENPREVQAALQPWSATYKPGSQPLPIARSEEPEKLYDAVLAVRRPPTPSSVAVFDDPLFPASMPTPKSVLHDSVVVPVPKAPPPPPPTLLPQPVATRATVPDSAKNQTPPPPGRSTAVVIAAIAIAVAVVAIVVCIVLGITLSGSPAKNSKAENPITQADELCRQQRWGEAADIYAKMLANADVAQQRDLLQRLMTKEREAVLPYLGERAPNDPVIQLAVGGYYMDKKQHQKALAIFVKLTAGPSPKGAAWWNLGVCQIHVGDWTHAVASLEKGIALMPKEPWCQAALVLTAAGLRQEELGRRHSLAMVDQLASIYDPLDLVQASLACGQYQLPREHMEKVQAAAERAVNGQRNNGRAHFALGLALFRLGEYEKCLEAFAAADTAREAWSGRKAMEPARALALLKLGRRDEAQRVFAECEQWRDDAKAKLPTGEHSYMAICWDMMAMENLRREAEEALRR